MLNWLNKILGKEEKSLGKLSGNKAGGKDGAPAANPLDGLQNQRFGRYSDNNKTLPKSRKWYVAEDLYKEKKYGASLEALFDYLRDDTEDNFAYEKTEKGFRFEFEQGSRKVYGETDDQFISARVPLAIMEKDSTAAMRRLLDLNYTLYYSRTALNKDKTLYMVFDSELSTASPNKLYYGLRELAIKADRQDDLLLADFSSSLKPADSSHIKPLSGEELDVKYKYFRRWIDDALEKVDSLNADTFSGAIAYLLLGAIYRIDFLITPEGRLLSELERVHNLYWEKKEDIPLVERNNMMRDALRKLLEISKEKFSESLFHAKGTFSMSSPSKTEKVRDHIFNANKDAHWYVENKYPQIAVWINEYGLLHNQFIYSMPKVQADLATIYMAVLHSDFFEELGLKSKLYDKQSKEFNIPAIESAIQMALNPFRDKHPSMKWDPKRVSYDNLFEFAISLSEQLAGLNLETKRI